MRLNVVFKNLLHNVISCSAPVKSRYNKLQNTGNLEMHVHVHDYTQLSFLAGKGKIDVRHVYFCTKVHAYVLSVA